MMNHFEHLRVERPSDGIVRVILDNHPQRNAMSPEMTRSWRILVSQLQADPSVRVVVVTGSGSSFCSGAPVSWLRAEDGATVDELRSRMLAFYRSWLSIRKLEVPVIAAVNGPAIGAGLCLALACDIRIGSMNSSFSAPFVKLGIHPGMAAMHLLQDVAGAPVARDMLLTGRLVGGPEALRLGLVTQLFDAERFEVKALEVAVGVAAAAPIASRLAVAALRSVGLDQAMQWDGLAQPVTMKTTDLREGLAAAAEGRPPRFLGA